MQTQTPPERSPMAELAAAAIAFTLYRLRQGETDRDSALEYLQWGIAHAETPDESEVFHAGLETLHSIA